MSRIATKPSAALTCSASRNRLQKRQSSGSEDPLLRDGASSHVDELPDVAAKKPGRVVVPVAAARPIDEDDVLAAQLRAPALEAGESRLLAQALAPPPLDPGRPRAAAG